jgi:hypothetical protein
MTRVAMVWLSQCRDLPESGLDINAFPAEFVHLINPKLWVNMHFWHTSLQLRR